MRCERFYVAFVHVIDMKRVGRLFQEDVCIVRRFYVYQQRRKGSSSRAFHTQAGNVNWSIISEFNQQRN